MTVKLGFSEFTYRATLPRLEKGADLRDPHYFSRPRKPSHNHYFQP